MKTRLLSFFYCLFGLLLSCSPLHAASSWTSVSALKPSWLVAGSGSYLYAADSTAIYKSSDSGITWQSATAPSGSPFSALAFVNSQLWVGTQAQGAAYSGNQGSSWTASSSGLISPLSGSALQINAIASRPGSSTSLVIGVSQGAYVSSDGGSAWSNTSIQGLPIIGTCPFCIKQAVYALAGFGSSTVLAGTDSGIYKSTDGGTNWASAGLTGSVVKQLSAAGSKAYALTDTGALYKTSSGDTWEQVTGFSATPTAVYAHPSTSGTVYIGTSDGKVLSSADDGASWTTISDSTLSGASVYAIAVPSDSATSLVVATSGGVFRYGAASTSTLVIQPATDVPVNTTITSDELTITGLQKAETISIVGGKYSINDGAFTSQPGVVANGARLRVQVQSSSSYNTSVTATVTIGTATVPFVATTLKITPVTSLTQVFTTAPTGAQIVEGKVVISTPVAVTLQSALPEGAIVETVAGTALSTSGGKVTFTDQSGGSLTFATVGTTTAPLVASGTFSVQSTSSGNVIPVGGGTTVGAITTTTTQDSLTLNRGSTQTSAFVQSGLVNIQSSGATSSTGVYGGETAEVTNRGSLNRVRIGSLSGDQNLPGDPVTVSNVTADSTIPNLSGNLARLGNTASLVDVIRNALNTQFGTTSGQVTYDATNKIVTYTVNGQVYRFIPLGVPTIQIGGSVASRFAATNPASSASGSFSLASNGISVTLASTVGYFNDLNQALKALDPNAKTRIRSSGALQLTINSADYLGIPGSNALGGGTIETPGFQLDSKGYYAFKDSTGAVQSLYPIFADTSVADQTVKAIDPNGSVTDNGNGTATMVLQGVSYTLRPGYPLISLPAAHASDLWWQDGATLYLRFPDSTAQGFTL